MAPKEMLAKYRGTCRECGGSIRKGDRITWARKQGARHVDCDSLPPSRHGGRCIDAPCCGCCEDYDANYGNRMLEELANAEEYRYETARW